MTSIEWVRGEDGSEGMSWNALRAERIDYEGRARSANHCEHVNEACRFCYAERMNRRLGGRAFKPGHRKDYRFLVDEAKLLAPIKRKKPTRIFVESMSDAFGEWWPTEFIDKLYAVMALCPQHTFINLSKRPGRRREYLADTETPERIAKAAHKIASRKVALYGNGNVAHDGLGNLSPTLRGRAFLEATEPKLLQWPLANVIEGTSVSNQSEADEFVPILLQTNAAWRAVSAEPLLGPIEFLDSDGGAFGTLRVRIPKRRPDIHPPITEDTTIGAAVSALGGSITQTHRGIDWIIVGGESGPNARPMHPDWARRIRDACEVAGVPFFFKQWGEFAASNAPEAYWASAGTFEDHAVDRGWCWGNSGGRKPELMCRVGKKAAGRLLDGRTHDGFPEIAGARAAA